MWLIHEEVARILQEARRAGPPSVAECTAFEAKHVVAEGRDPYNMRRAGSVAEIRVEGVLTKKPDFFAWLFGGGNTTYESIVSGLAIAKNDSLIKEVVLAVDSPGGQVDGLFDALEAIRDFRASDKKISVRASNAQSAAYAIAAMGGKITAQTSASFFGSIGTAVSYFVDDAIVELTNTDSPNKRPDVRTEEGRAVVRKLLDAINDQFVTAIANGRGTTKEDVVENFGRGETLVAVDAKRLGMIDAIAVPAMSVVNGARAEGNAPPVRSGAQQKDKGMDEKELRAQHPELYAAVFAAGEKQGQAQERDRCIAHLTLGETSGDLKTAIDAVKSGEIMTMTLQAKYMAAAMNRRDQSTRQEDSAAASAAVAAAAAPAVVTKDAVDVAAERMAERRGKEVARA